MRVMLDTNIFISMIFFPSAQTREVDWSEFPQIRDGKDLPILATAIMEEIDVFLTGDKDFLVMDVETPEVLTMKQFLERY